LSWKLRIINKQSRKSGKSFLLDYGCGTGQFLQKCQADGWHIQGVEPSEHARSLSSRLTQTSIAPNLDNPAARTFEIITLWHVLEHIPDLNETLQSLRTALTDSGTMFIAVPNHNSWDAKHYKQYWAGYDVPRHIWHFTQSNMKSLLKRHDLRIINTLPMKLDAFYVSLLSEKYQRKPQATMFIKAIINGIRSNYFAHKQNEYSSLIYIVKK
jgi:2-polyprenyl-3-methyl-5-hydroxy-6-metoxy-1,4-benzoquinol methylase